jgi:hypothetical protein
VTTLAYLWLAWSLCLLPFLVGWIRADHKHCVAYYVILLWKFYGHGGSSMKPITENTLFYGDNLIILREHIPNESVNHFSQKLFIEIGSHFSLYCAFC